MTTAPAAIILAAGKGTRMQGDLPKVVHPVGGRPMVCAVVDACEALGSTPIVAVVGYKQELVRDALAPYPAVRFAVQEQQLGTGHAVLSAEGSLAGLPADTDTFVLCGDGPLIRPQTLRELLERHRTSGAAATLATSIIEDPTGYGRIVRDASGRFREIVEHKNASPEQRQIREVNPSYYCFRLGELLSSLRRVQRNPLSGEYYLTDTLALLLAEGKRVEVIPSVPPEDVLSINTPEDLAVVDRLFRARPATPENSVRASRPSPHAEPAR
jgi:bifunctional UDP-N-acetylglucosamine pyrophosphorylase/glucosamine-1-phosphate N-acetyltransferase